MKKYKKQFKEMFLSQFIGIDYEETNLEKEFIKHFDTVKFIEQFSKAILHLSEKMQIDSKEETTIYGLAYYLLSESKQELMNEYDSLVYNDTVIQDRLSLHNEDEKLKFISNVDFFTNELNFNLFGKTDSDYQNIFEDEQKRFSQLMQDSEFKQTETKTKYEYQNFLFETVFTKYHYLILIGEKKFVEAEKLWKDKIERIEREKTLLHRHIEQIEISEFGDKRKPKLKAEDCLKEYFGTEKFDKLLSNEALTPIIINWAVKKGYKKFSIKTIRPKISQFRNLSE